MVPPQGGLSLLDIGVSRDCQLCVRARGQDLKAYHPCRRCRIFVVLSVVISGKYRHSTVIVLMAEKGITGSDRTTFQSTRFQVPAHLYTMQDGKNQ